MSRLAALSLLAASALLVALLAAVVARYPRHRQCDSTVAYNKGTEHEQLSRCVRQHDHTEPMHTDGRLYWGDP